MSTLNVATIKSLSSSAPVFQNTSGVEKGQLCKAWIKMNGTGTVSIDGSFNVSSITDNGVGTYIVHFSNALSNANYSVGGFSHRNGAPNAEVLCHIDTHGPQAVSTTQYPFALSSTTNGQNVGLTHVDVSFISLQFFGD